jgi:hypothetical protein
MLKTNTTTPDNEVIRIASIQFLFSAKNAAHYRADAAEAERFGDYQNARAHLQTVRGDLRNIEVNPALPPTNPYNVRINHRYLCIIKKDRIPSSGVHVWESLLDGILETIPASQYNQSLLLHVAHRHGIHPNERHLHILILCLLYHLFKDAN